MGFFTSHNQHAPSEPIRNSMPYDIHNLNHLLFNVTATGRDAGFRNQFILTSGRPRLIEFVLKSRLSHWIDKIYILRY